MAVIKPKQPSGYDVFYVWADHLNTPRIVSDAQNAIRWEWPLEEAFGANAPNENPAGLGAFSYNLRFPGQYYDAETGMHYNYFRDYDPSIGRYIQSDPIGLTGGFNTYAYALSNPLTWSDPTGLAVGDWWDFPANLRRAQQIGLDERARRPSGHNDSEDAMRTRRVDAQNDKGNEFLRCMDSWNRA